MSTGRSCSLSFPTKVKGAVSEISRWLIQNKHLIQLGSPCFGDKGINEFIKAAGGNNASHIYSRKSQDAKHQGRDRYRLDMLAPALVICCGLLWDAEPRGPLGQSAKAVFMQQLIASLVKFQVSCCLFPNLSCLGSSHNSSSAAAAPSFLHLLGWFLCDHLL